MSGDNPYPWRQGRSQPQIDVSNQSNQPHLMGSEQQRSLETGGFYVAKQPTVHYGSGSGAKPANELGSSFVPKQHYVPQPQKQEFGAMYGPPPQRTPREAGMAYKSAPKPVHPRNQELGAYYTPKPGTQSVSGPDYQPPPQAPSYQQQQWQQPQQQPQHQQPQQPHQQYQQPSQPEASRKITQISIGQLSPPQPEQAPSQPQFPQQPQQQQYQQPQPYQPQYQPQQQQYQPPQQQYQPPQQQYQPQYQPAPSGGSLPQHLQQKQPQQSVASPAEFIASPQSQHQYRPQPQQQQQPAGQPARRRGKFSGSVKVFTPEQVERYRRVFDAFDVNRNGVLEAHELLPVARELGYRLPKEQLDDILRSFDLDSYGILTFDEFLEAMPGNIDLIPEDEHRRAEIRHKFQLFDRDCNGYISREEAHGVLFRELGFDREKSNSLINQFDINADGQLSYEEFIGFYMKVRERKDAIDVAFRQFDRDNKGYVSMADAKRILKGQLFADYEVEAIVRAHDTNHDGKLQYEEFVHFWTA